jgi:opacity protein-like surface antigen
MKKLLTLFALLALSSFSTFAQRRGEETPLIEVNGGYTYMRWQVPAFAQPPSSLNYNGFNVGAALNFTRWLALAVDLSGVYNTEGPSSGNATQHIYSYLAGPRIYPVGHHKLSPYIHGLIGVASYHLHVPDPDPTLVFNETDNNLSFDVGGGVDWKLSRHFAFRVGQVDYQQTRALRNDAVLSGASPSNQNNFKFSTGLVIRFGEK